VLDILNDLITPDNVTTNIDLIGGEVCTAID
jgi:hypothetical protein